MYCAVERDLDRYLAAVDRWDAEDDAGDALMATDQEFNMDDPAVVMTAIKEMDDPEVNSRIGQHLKDKAREKVREQAAEAAIEQLLSRRLA